MKNPNSQGSDLTGQVIAHFGNQSLVKSTPGKIYNCQLRQNLPAITVGDFVTFNVVKDNDAVITKLGTRETLLARKPINKPLTPVAANIDLVLIVFALSPKVSFVNIDRYLIAANLSNINCALVLNKFDLYKTKDKTTLSDLSIYQKLGIDFIQTSTVAMPGLDSIYAILKDKTAVLVGTSGVGKSSIINKLIPQANADVGDLSKYAHLGKHTTTVARMYEIPSLNCNIVDSPGVRQFGLDKLEFNQICESYVEFKDYLGKCKFSDCIHLHEKDCAIKDAVHEGKISALRYNNFLTIVGNK